MSGHSWRMVMKSTLQDTPRALLVTLLALVIAVARSCHAYINSPIQYNNKRR